VRVWEELRAQGSIAGDLRQEAETVADETMRRVAHNLDLLASRLESKGWIASMGELRTTPKSGDSAIFKKIEKITKSPIPPSLLSFWRIVGGVALVWDYGTEERPPQIQAKLRLDLGELDPLSVDSPTRIEYLFEEWEEQMIRTHSELLDPFSIDLAPDDLHKANISGGPPYAIELPFFGADPIFANESHELPFVDYLRHCLRWAGFGKLDKHKGQDGADELIAELTAGFEPF
jgi:hypothetical protein